VRDVRPQGAFGVGPRLPAGRQGLAHGAAWKDGGVIITDFINLKKGKKLTKDWKGSNSGLG
jgi:hypothetical protein